MKNPTIFRGLVESVAFPNKGRVIPAVTELSDTEASAAVFSAPESSPRPVSVKNVLPGQTVEVFQSPHQRRRREGTLLKVLSPAGYEIPSACPHCAVCGGCSYQTVPYGLQLDWKASMVRRLLEEALSDTSFEFLPIAPSPLTFGYRNKMEFSFGDEYKGGPLALGLHKRGAFYDIVPVTGCQIVHEDFRRLVSSVLEYFTETGADFHNTRSHTGFLRHLVLRRSFMDGSMLLNLITSSDGALNTQEFVRHVRGVKLEGTLNGLLHTVNDSLADIVRPDECRLLYGSAELTEMLLGLTFRLSPFSFFQTNTLGAEVLYRTVLDFAGDLSAQTVFDLYCGTGTIAQLIASAGAARVLGIELVEEAVRSARENAVLNGLDNCSFLAGDVLKLVETLTVHPDLIVLDPPRDGIHPKALPKILSYQPERFIYVSCKPTSLARDLPCFIEAGYRLEKVSCVDMFPGTVHVETVALLTRKTTVIADAGAPRECM